jgi:LPS sulfotransferase NodH
VLFQVVGVPRSGTTLLANLISAHPDAFCMSEPYFTFFARGCCVDGDERLGEHPNRFVSRVMRSRPESRVGVKETYAANQRFYEALKEAGTITIAILRDPRDTQASVRDFLGHENLERFASKWSEFVQWAGVHADVTVSYEDLVREPIETMARVFDRLGLSSEGYVAIPAPMYGIGDPRALAGDPLDTRSIGSYRTRLPDGAAEWIEERCRAEMRALGYLPDAVSA